MKKAERLNWIVMTLRQRGKMTAAQLSDYMEVSRRTIYRDMTALAETHVPISAREGAEGGYEIDPDYFLPTLRLNEREILILLMLLKVSDELRMGDFLPDIRTLGHKLLEICQDGPGRLQRALERIHFDLNTIVPECYPEGLFDRILESFLRNRRLRITYFTPLRGDVAERAVTPLDLFFAEGCWYLSAHCHTRKEPRTFRLDRIRDAVLLEEAADAAAQAARHESLEPLQEVVLDLEPRLFDLIKADQALQGCEVTPRGDGWLRVRVACRRLDYFEQLAFRNIGQAAVLAPPALLTTLRAKFAQGTRVYCPER